jgi:hypothetical protein
MISFSMFGFTNCRKEAKNLDGEYTGTFVRSAPNIRAQSAKVTLYLAGNTFKGSSDIKNYPAICEGTFTITSSKIDVSNDCMFTADFDWSLVLKGEYNYELSGKQLKITRAYPGNKYDTYTLEKRN